MNEYNAKNLPFDQPGAGTSNYGVDKSNVWDQINRLRTHGDEKAGGSKEIWGNLGRWTETDNAQHFVKTQPDQAAAWNEYIKTGVRPANLKDETAMAATDWALRDTGRAQQHKPVNFFTEYLMDPLVEAALGAINPGLAIAYGGIKGGVEDGFMGGLTGALSGYGAGNFGAGLYGAGSAAGGLEGFMNDPLSWASNMGSNAVSSATNTLSNIGNGVTNFLEHPIDTTTNLLGFGGTPAAGGGAQASALPGYSNSLGAGGTPLTSTGVTPTPGMGVGAGGGDLSGVAGAPASLTDGSALYNPDALTGAASAASTATDVPVIAPSAAHAAGSIGTTAMNALNKLGINSGNLPMLALQGYNAFKGPQASTGEKTIRDQLAATNQATAPFTNEAKQLLDFYNSGKLHPSDEQAITQQVQQEQARVNDYWARAGAPNSTGRIQMLQDIDKKATALRDQTRQGYLISAIQSGQFGVQASQQLTQTLAQIQALGDRDASAALDSFLSSIANSNGYGRYNATPAVKPA